MPVLLDQISVNGRQLLPGMEVTLRARPGLLPARYEVLRIEQETGAVLLTVYGPLRKRVMPRRRYVRPEQVGTVHVRTRGNRG